MNEATSHESATGPVETPAATTTPVVVHDHDRYRDVDERPRRSRLNVVAAWVGIVAGTVFVVAVIFFSGFVLGASVSGGGGYHHGGHHGQGQMDRGGGGGPRHHWQGGPGGPGGPAGFRPGFQGGQGGGPGYPGFPGGGPGGAVQGPGQGSGPVQGPGFLPQTPPSR